MINLYPLHQKVHEINEMLRESGEMTPEIMSAFEALQLEKGEKLEAIAALIKNTEAEIEVFKAERVRLENQEAILERRVERFKDAVGELLAKTDKWEGGVHKMSWRPAKSIEVTDLEAIPLEFVREKVTVEADKKTILALLKSEPGLEIPGVQVVEKYHLQVK